VLACCLRVAGPGRNEKTAYPLQLEGSNVCGCDSGPRSYLAFGSTWVSVGDEAACGPDGVTAVALYSKLFRCDGADIQPDSTLLPTNAKTKLEQTGLRRGKANRR